MEAREILDSKLKRRVKRKLSAEKPLVWIGKGGVTQRIVDETSRHLGRTEMVKVKLLENALKNGEAKTLAAQIALKTESVLIDIRGHTFLLYKPKKRKV